MHSTILSAAWQAAFTAARIDPSIRPSVQEIEHRLDVVDLARRLHAEVRADKRRAYLGEPGFSAGP